MGQRALRGPPGPDIRDRSEFFTWGGGFDPDGW